MKIYDISQEVFSCTVYPGDPSPKKQTLYSINKGDAYNLTAFSMCAHNGTHIDAPSHFIKNGKAVNSIPLDYFIGECLVCAHQGELSGVDAEKIISLANSQNPRSAKRILLKGNCIVTTESALVFAQKGIYLLGVESQTVGDPDSPARVHRLLLSANVVLLEGLRLSNVPDGSYFLSAPPLNLSDSDGAPTRAVLIADYPYATQR